MLKNRLPPLEPLVAFEAAARLLSFTRASVELHLTQAAVSQQIRNLEQNLQVKLFNRSHRAVQLTHEGREYHHAVSGLLKQLASVTNDIKSVEVSPRLSIACDQSFASLWLSPRLARFQQLNPRISLRLNVSDNETDCLTDGIQLSILHGEGYWPGYQSLKLFGEVVFPVCSPQYLDGQDIEDWREWLLQVDLLDLDDSHWNWMNWRAWFAGQGVDEALQFRNLQINSYPLLIEAACRSQGVALGWDFLVNDRIKSGELVRPVKPSLATDYGYYLIVKERDAAEPEVEQFRQWLKAGFNLVDEL